MQDTDFIWSSLVHTPECLDMHRISRFNDDVKEELVNILNIKTPSDLIEIGCGPGTLSYKLYCWFHGLHVTAFDLDREFINYASSHYPGPHFICGDARNFNTNKKYDYVLSHTIMEYMDESCFFEVNRRLVKPNGLLIIISNVKSIQFDNYLLSPPIDELNSFLSFSRQQNNEAVNQVLHKQNIGYSEFLDRFERNGFDIISQNYIACETIPQNHSIEQTRNIIEMYRAIQKSTFITAWNRCMDIPTTFSYNKIIQLVDNYYNKVALRPLEGWPATVDLLRITRAQLASAHSDV